MDMKKILLVLSMFLTACSSKDQISDNIVVNKSYNKSAIDLLERDSNNGDPSAMFLLGSLYLEGKNIEKNELKGLELIRLSAEKDYDPAILFMGGVYAFGRYGTLKDRNKAIDYWIKLGNKNNVIAQLCIGEIYQISKDYKNAFEWHTKAYKNGSFLAAFYIATFYELGFYVKKDFQKALEYYIDASNKGSVLADNRLGFLYFANPLIKNYEKSFSYYMKAANKGDIGAQRLIGIFTIAGLGIKADFEKGLSWLRKIALHGDKESAELTVIYTDPEIIGNDTNRRMFQEKLRNTLTSSCFADIIDAKLKLKEEIKK